MMQPRKDRTLSAVAGLLEPRAMSLLACIALGFGICPGTAAAAEVTATLAQDDTQQTKYDITVRNDTSSALSGFSTRVYFDIAELISTGLDAAQVRCDKRYDATGAATCSIAQFNGSTYYAEVRFGTFSLAAGASAGYKLTLRLADYSRRWSSANDYSRVGLSSTPTVTARLPVYQGATRISGTDPGAGTPGPTPTPAPTPTIDNVAPSAPSGVQAQAVSSSRIDLSWNASSDNVGVSGYRVYRDAALVGSPASTSFSDTNRAAATVYTYVVRANDAAGNLSAASAQVSVQTQAGSGSGSCAAALSSAASIQTAMLNANPGTVIRIAPGIYTGNRATSGDPRVGNGLPLGVFYSGRSGTASAPIVLKGCDPSQPAVLRGSANNDGSYGLHLTGDYWEVRDLAVQDAQKGIMLDTANRNLISGVIVHDVGDEAVHFRDGSSYNVIEYSRIYNTGGYQPQFGEGVYVGSDGGTSTYEHTVIDNVIRHVRFEAGITAEHLDVKEGATGTLIEYNDFNGTGISGQNSADSFIDIKGVNSIVRFNTGRRNGNANVVDAFQVRTHGSCCLTGTNNRFNDNSVHLDGIGSGSTNGYVVFATSQTSGTTSSNDRRTDGNTNIFNKNINK